MRASNGEVGTEYASSCLLSSLLDYFSTDDTASLFGTGYSQHQTGRMPRRTEADGRDGDTDPTAGRMLESAARPVTALGQDVCSSVVGRGARERHLGEKRARGEVQVSPRARSVATITEFLSPVTRPSQTERKRRGSVVKNIPDSRSAEALSLLLLPEATIAERYDLSLADVEHLLQQIACRHSPLLHSSFNLYGVAVSNTYDSLRYLSLSPGCAPHPQKCEYVTTGLKTLDESLCGGLRSGFITELSGPPASGKTTLVLCWTVHAMLEQGPEAAALWMHSSPRPFAAHRISAIVSQYGKESSKEIQCIDSRISLAEVDTVETLIEVLPRIEKFLCISVRDPVGGKAGRTRLLVIDNLSVMVRRSFPGIESETVNRQELLVRLVQQLKGIAERCQVTVLIITGRNADGGSATCYGQAEGLAGEFGPLFFHAVNVRLQLSERCEWARSADGLTVSPVQHILEIAKSPVCAPTAIPIVFDQFTVREADQHPTHCKRGDRQTLTDESFSSIDAWDHCRVPTFVAW